MLGSALWTLGLLGASHLAFLFVTQYVPHVLVIQHWTVLGLLAVVFMLGGLTQVRRGLTPINDLRQRLAALREGHTRRLEGDYPTEVQPLVDDLNALLERREEAVRRAHARAGDLAHGLKTPLALLTQEADEVRRAGHNELAQSIQHEIARMRRQVDYHLVHARAAASTRAPGTRTVVADSIESLVRTLRRLHGERQLELRVRQGRPDLAVIVERQDLDEMIGNLLDNAFKWARSRIDVSVCLQGTLTIISVDDDGPGLNDAQRRAVLDRGVRADDTTPGSGLGLAIVRDLAAVYGGAIDLAGAPLGGLRAELRLPGA
jgi:signal transduction histidine kinase